MFSYIRRGSASCQIGDLEQFNLKLFTAFEITFYVGGYLPSVLNTYGDLFLLRLGGQNIVNGMSVKLATTPATFLATKINFDQNDMHDQHDQENHEYDIGSALNLKLQGQRAGNRKWPIRYCRIFNTTTPKCSPCKVRAAHRKPFSSRSNFKVKFKVKGR